LLYWRWAHHLLGPNWIEKAQRVSGDWILRFLIFTLCISPLRKLPGLTALIRYRRMVGLFAFFYACVHFAIYLWFDKGLDWTEIRGDFTRRWFYIFGLVAFVALIPLAATSTAGWIRRLGGRRWQLLHRLIYVSVLAGALHYYLQGKSIVLRAVYYALVIVFLLLWRVAMRLAGRKRGPRVTPATSV
jgi:sulfoxide reductase heme-binding subunit YedZ